MLFFFGERLHERLEIPAVCSYFSFHATKIIKIAI
jgi:hypothetical protein